MKNLALKKSRGTVLVVVIIIIMSFAIMIPAIVSFVKNEAKWSVKESKQTAAFHLAEAAHDRGYWKLSESSNNWTTVVGGATIAGYANDVVYNDVSGGSYKISIYKISASSLGILATAKDSAGKEFRAIRSIYSKTAIVTPIQVPSYSASGNFMVWWGPIYSIGDITVSGASNQLYPRKMARGKIDPRDTNPAWPNIDSNLNPEWWSYNTYPVPDAPVPDLAWYEAQSHIAPNEYYSSFKAFPNSASSVSIIRWCAAGGSISAVGTSMMGQIFSMGDFTIDKKGGWTHTVTAPAEAWREYVRATPNGSGGCADSAAQDEYPGDGGYHTSKAYTFGTTAGGGPNKNPSFRGFVYVSGTFSGGANANIHGAIVVANGGGFGGGGADLFYDETLSVQFSASSVGVRTSWKEEAAMPF